MSRTGMLLVEQACSDRASPSDRVTAERCVYNVLYSYDGLLHHNRWCSRSLQLSPLTSYTKSQVHDASSILPPIRLKNVNGSMPKLFMHESYCLNVHINYIHQGNGYYLTLRMLREHRYNELDVCTPPHPRLQQICRW